ncbi:Type IV pilus biogenesis and competence protein PilQ precursor [Pseudovibrio axinellae]|uniref:Type IV pilus biogenesis and competence protein PilQ n=1 Tax=Pseudovibrio axinellae TaxID=989403 RepID=A0A166B7R7_9HYPH|nr:type II and III secretion system protein family protein [Pseudovibrio axinellae]KZL21993.1 Type IV pilus biogenesis and competence protein PilQ precursor [Pseudovibrio axinellae]SEQ59505.1 pilus assembly protein CpaC [Pseudovibrio axinellae]
MVFLQHIGLAKGLVKSFSYFKKLLRLTFAVGLVLSAPHSASAQTHFEATVEVTSQYNGKVRQLNVGKGRSIVLNTNEEVRDVLVSNPDIADAVVRTRNRVFVFGNEIGQASLVLFGNGGRQLASFNLNVQPDPSGLVEILGRLLPNSAINADIINESIVLSGTAVSPLEAQQAYDIALKFVGNDDKKIVNTIGVAEKDQVQLKVTVAEVERTTIKQLGMSLEGSIKIGALDLGFNTSPAYNVNSSVVNAASLAGDLAFGGNSISPTIKALERDGVMRTLAEPTLVAVSGENASFLAGGEFPIPVAYEDNKVSLEFKPFGVGLDFTPVVLSGGRIKLRVKTEVSELSSEGAVSIAGAATVSALKVRRAESTLELPSGGTLVMAGLLKENYGQEVDGVPGLKDLPILGNMFKSRDYINRQTELVIFVTPYVVRPIARSQVARPDDNFAAPSDQSAIFLNQLSSIYRATDAPVKGTYHGSVGYIYE